MKRILQLIGMLLLSSSLFGQINQLRVNKLKVKELPFVDVTAHGATGDGVTDDSAGILAALAAADGAKVIFPAGTYVAEATALTSLTESVDIEGIGKVIIDGDDNADSGFVFAANLDYVKIRNITFQDIGDYVIAPDVATRTVTIVEIEDTYVTSSTSGYFFACLVSGGYFKNNSINGLEASSGSAVGIQIGANTYASQDSYKKFEFSGNKFIDINHTSSGGESHAILVYGREVIITNNIVEDITNGGSTGAEGIYTKVRFGNVSNNIFINAGIGEGSLNCKGAQRAASSSPQGYGINISENQFYSSTGAYSGASIRCEDVTVQNNYFEGFGGYAIITGNDAFNNIAIKDNKIRAHRGIYAIWFRAYGDSIKVNNNEIMGLLGTQGTPSSVIGIFMQPVDDSGIVELIGNHITSLNETAASATLYGIRLNTPTGKTFAQVNVKNNTVRVTDGEATPTGIFMDGSGTITKLNVQDNDALDSTTSFSISSTTTTTLNIIDNQFYRSQGSGVTAMGKRRTDSIQTNTGASGTIEKDLPAAEVGMRVTVIRTASFLLRVDPNGTDTIGSAAAGKYLELDTDGDSVVLECITANAWNIVGGNGTYNYETDGLLTTALSESSDIVTVNATLNNVFTLTPTDDDDGFTLGALSGCVNGKQFTIIITNNGAVEDITYNGTYWTLMGTIDPAALSQGAGDITYLGFSCTAATTADGISISRTTEP